MKKAVILFWAMCLAPFAFAQSTAWQKLVYRSENGAIIFWIQAGDDMLVTKALYQGLNSKEKVELAYAGKTGDGGQTEQDRSQFKHPQTGETFGIMYVGMGAAIVMPDGNSLEFMFEDVYAYNTERLYITPPPMVVYLYYSNNSLPVAQPIISTPCDQKGGEAVWTCQGTIPVTKSKCTAVYNAAKSTITLTTPKGTKVFKKIEE